eukprot:COSAG06_NODE_2998_length_5979_cov_10.676075_6_plen_206_part_00
MPSFTDREQPEESEQDILPEIVIDESVEQYVQQLDEELDPDPEPPTDLQKQAEPPAHNDIVIEAELPPAPEQDSIFQTGKPVKKKRVASEKQRAHLERIRAKALERKREKADERKVARTASQKATQPAAPETALEPTPAPTPAPTAPRVEPVPPAYLTHDDVDNILLRYDEWRQKRKDAKRKEAQAQQLVSTHLQEDDVWAQCFN